MGIQLDQPLWFWTTYEWLFRFLSVSSLEAVVVAAAIVERSSVSFVVAAAVPAPPEEELVFFRVAAVAEAAVAGAVPTFASTGVVVAATVDGDHDAVVAIPSAASASSSLSPS